jgi:hypothetical protein
MGGKIPFGFLKYVVPYAGNWRAPSKVLYYSPEYHNSRQNIIILSRKYLVDIRSEAWLNLYWEYTASKFVPCSEGRKNKKNPP